MKKEQWVEHRFLCGLSNFKAEGKMLQITNYIISGHLTTLKTDPYVYKILNSWEMTINWLFQDIRRTETDYDQRFEHEESLWQKSIIPDNLSGEQPDRRKEICS